MLVRTAWFVILLLVQSVAYANVMGPAEVQKLYERVKTTLDNPTPEEPFYLKSENDKNIESGEAAFYLPLGMDQIADSLSSVQNWCEITTT